MLREDIYQWVLNTEGNPQRVNPARLDKVWLLWSDRLMTGKKTDNENQLFKLASVLQGETPVDNDVKCTIMKKGLKRGTYMIWPSHDVPFARAFLRQKTWDPSAGCSYIMFPNTEWAHLMAPIRDVKPSFGDY